MYTKKGECGLDVPHFWLARAFAVLLVYLYAVKLNILSRTYTNGNYTDAQVRAFAFVCSGLPTVACGVFARDQYMNYPTQPHDKKKKIDQAF
jgi:ABC-type dipeptide/oligopeptide/nickel transport system permease component